MKRYIIFKLLILLCIFSPFRTLWAQNHAYSGLALHLEGGFTVLDSYGLAQIDSAFLWRTKISYEFPKKLQLGLAFQQSRSQSILEQDATLRSILFEPAYILFDQNFSPFAKGIIGYQWAHLTQIDDTQGLLFGVGIGARSRWNEIISSSIGLDMNIVQMNGLVDDTLINWNMYIGASLHFGGTKNTHYAEKQKAAKKTGLIEPQICTDVPKGLPVDKHGCPLDFDQDQIPDHLDHCPGTQSKNVDSMGCPLEHFARGIIREISFEAGSARLTNQSYKHLQKIASSLKRFPEVHFLIEGHTDNTGDPQENLILSQARAQTVVNALVQYGVQKENISPIGYGQQYPVAPNTDKHGRDINRRVEIKWQNQ
ncbi:MAG: OmpA family protein [Bdellovibrionales bacterium]|nr:OmpA family protein [Bdellovibrionales bacterium]